MAANQNAGSIVYEVDMDLAGFLRGQKQVSDSLSGMNRGFDASTRSINNTERSVNSAERSFSSLTKVAAALTAALSVQQVAQYADAWVTVNNKLANAIRPNEQLADVTQRVFDISQKTMSSLDATAALYGRLERATRSTGTSTADLVKLTETINKGLAVSGATTAEASSTMIQLSQALASGVLRGEEFNSISENGSRLAVGLAESLGVTVGQLRAMAAQGQLTTDVVVKGLLSQGDQIAKEFANTAMTMGQAFTIATNNVTKFVGESSTIKSAYNGFNSTIVTLSQNLETLSTVFIALGAVMGSRFAGALAMATAAQFKNTFSSIANAKAAAESAKAAELEAGAKLRLAQADKSAAVSALNAAQTRLNLLKETNAASVAEVKLANAEAATIRTQIAQIESEKALETVRLKAQITDQGRIATATRMAQLQQASSVLTTRLAAAEATASQAKATAIVAAEAEVSAARITTATVTGTASAANGIYTASQEATVIANRAASASLGLLRGAMGLLGGPAGIIMIAAAGLYFWFQRAEQAKQEAIAFADSLNTLNSSMKSMNNTQLKGTIADANESIIAQKSDIKDLQEEIDSLRNRYRNFTPEAQKAAESIGNGAAYASEMAKVSRDLDQKTRDLANKQEKLAKTTDTASEANRLLTNNMLTSMGVHDGLIEKGSTLEQIQGAVAKAFGNTADEINRANQAGQNFKPTSLEVSPTTKKGDKYISDLSEQNELLSIQDERLRAVTKAGIEAAKVTDNPNQIAQAKQLAGENYDLQKAEDARNKATKESTAEGKRAETQAESVAQKLNKLRAQSDLTTESIEKRRIEEAGLRAQQSLGSSASQQQLAEAKALGEANEQAALSIQKRKEAEQGQKFAKQEIASTQSKIDPATGKAIDPVAQVNLQEQQKLEALAKYQALDTQNTALYEQAKIAIQSDAAMQRKQISDDENEHQRQNMSALLGATSDFFGQMAGAIGDYAGESSAAYKTLFAISKGFAIAQASMNLVTAISNAAALPWPANIPAIAFAAAQGANLISQIRGAKYGGGRENGGPVSAGSMYRVGEKGKPEIYQAGSGKQFMIPGDNGKVISNKDMQSGSGGGLNFVLNITNTNGSRVETSEPQYNNGYLTMEMFIGDMQQGGPMSRSITGTTSATRRATE